MSVTLIVGDVHLGKGLSMGRPGIGSSLNGRVADQFRLLDWIFEQAIEHQAGTIIFTGDICEEVKPDYILMVHFIQWLKKCEAYNIEIHIIAGNHDIKRSGNYYTSALDVIQSAEVPNTTIYKQIDTIYNGTVGFTLLPFRDRRSLNTESGVIALGKVADLISYELEDIPSTYDKVLIGHMALEGSIIVGDEFDDAANELMCPMEMFKGYDYVWMGHVHKPQIRSKTPYIAHIGSLDLSDFGEVDHQKIIVLYDSKCPDKFREIEVPSRALRLFKIEITGQEDATISILNALEKADKKATLKDSVVRIDVQLQGLDAINANRDKIIDAVYNIYGAHYLCSFTESRATIVVPQEKRKNLDTSIQPREAIKKWADSLDIDESEKKLYIAMALETIDQVDNE